MISTERVPIREGTRWPDTIDVRFVEPVEGPAQPAELTEGLGVSRSVVSAPVDSLDEDDSVDRDPDRDTRTAVGRFSSGPPRRPLERTTAGDHTGAGLQAAVADAVAPEGSLTGPTTVLAGGQSELGVPAISEWVPRGVALHRLIRDVSSPVVERVSGTLRSPSTWLAGALASATMAAGTERHPRSHWSGREADGTVGLETADRAPFRGLLGDGRSWEGGRLVTAGRYVLGVVRASGEWGRLWGSTQRETDPDVRLQESTPTRVVTE